MQDLTSNDFPEEKNNTKPEQRTDEEKASQLHEASEQDKEKARIARRLEEERASTYLCKPYVPGESTYTPYVETEVRCPTCGSTQVTAAKKGFGLGKAAIGGVLLGGVGLLGGFVGSRKVQITCLKCGNTWAAGSN